MLPAAAPEWSADGQPGPDSRGAGKPGQARMPAESRTAESPLSASRTGLVLVQPLRRGLIATGRAGPQWAVANCAASVEPDRAVVEASGLIAWVTWSKYPVPTSRWCRVAV